MWETVWPDLPAQEVPISHITNGIHVPTWTSRKMRKMFEENINIDWMRNQDNVDYWSQIDKIDDKIVWETKLELKEKLLNHVRERLTKQYKRNRLGSHQILRVKQLMRKEVLTIGFARRFATYKRATLIFRDRERIKRILNNPNKPVQILFAGKAHPKDGGGQDLIREIHQISLEPEFKGKVAFVENYDMGLARDLISGVDVWLNTPRRRQEASGTSGEKAGANGVLNFSVLDGWWCEGYLGNNGWAFGDNEDIHSNEELDAWDSEELYDILENDIIPLYYSRNEDGTPTEWLQRIKDAIKTVLPTFNTNRMVKDYLRKMYLPAIELGEKYEKNDYVVAKDLATWKERILSNWSEVAINPLEKSELSNRTIIIQYGESKGIQAKVKLGNLSTSDVLVQVYLKQIYDYNQKLFNYEVFEMEFSETLGEGEHLYKAVIQPSDSGKYQYTFRVIPYHPDLRSPMELGLARWYRIH
jgi:starch phosphorylase